MPYPGIKPEDKDKMESCVEKVMRTGKSKDVSIAICAKSINGSKEESLAANFIINNWIIEARKCKKDEST